MKINFQKLLPHIIALLAFISIVIFFFYPVLQGKRVYQGDVVNYKGMANESEFYYLRHGEWPLWTNSTFSGMPAFQISARYPANIFNKIYQTVNSGFKTGNFMLIALIGFYILLIAVGVNPWLAIGGAIAYALSTYFFIIIEVGHNSKTMALALLPPIVAGVLLVFKHNYLAGSAILAFFLPLNLIANHPQMTYYFFIMLGIFILIEGLQALKTKQVISFLKPAGILAIIGFLALGSNCTLLWMTNEYGKYSTRSKSELTLNKEVQTSGLDKDYATDWSYGISETFTFLIPNFAGNSSPSDLGTKSELYKSLREMGVSNAREFAGNAPTYWGSQPFTSGPFYMGATVIFLFVLALFFVEGPFKWWLVAATILSVLLGWGKNFMALTDIFLDYFPLYNKFRAVVTILVISMFTIPLLGFFGLDRFLQNGNGKNTRSAPDKKRINSLKYATLIVTVILLFLILFASLLFDFSAPGDKRLEEMGWPMDALRADRLTMLKTDGMRSLIFMLLCAGILFAWLKKWVSKEILIFSIIVLIAFDLGWVGKRYLPLDKFVSPKTIRLPYEPTSADLSILQNEMRENSAIAPYSDSLIALFRDEAREDARVSKPGSISAEEEMITRFAALNKMTNYRVLNLAVSTFNDASTSYFHKSIGGYHGAKMKKYQELIEYQISRRNKAVLDMLNTKYLIVPDSGGAPRARMNFGQLGPAWFAEEFKLVENADSEILALNNFNPAQTAIVDKRFSGYLEGIQPGKPDTTGSIKLTSYDLDNLSYMAHSSSEHLVVFSEIYYDKGWQAYIDGKKTEHIRVNYVLRAMRLPAGDHKVEFQFHPENYYRGEKIAFASSLMLILYILGAVGFLLKKQLSGKSLS